MNKHSHEFIFLSEPHKALLRNWDVPCGTMGHVDATNVERVDRIIEKSIWVVADNFHNWRVKPHNKNNVPLITDTLITAVVAHKIEMVACLLRVQWDCAKKRRHMFSYPFAGSIRLSYRPSWCIHEYQRYQWLIWDTRHDGEPIIRYDDGA